MAKNIVILDEFNEELYPKTTAKNIIVENGLSLQQTILNIEQNIEESETKKEFTYSNVLCNSDRMIFALIKPSSYNSVWSFKVRVIAEVVGKSNTQHVTDLYVGGSKGEITSYIFKNNMVDSIKHTYNYVILSLTNLIGFNLDKNSYFGIELRDEYVNNRVNITVIFDDVQAALVDRISTPKRESDAITNKTLYSDTNRILTIQNGVFTNIHVTRDELSAVAFSGSYNDLLDKPDLLQVDVNDETAVFYKE